MKEIKKMVKLPEPIDPTLEAMKAECSKYMEPRRNYIGASYIGRECARQIWYEYNGYPKEPYSVYSLWNFEDGHRTEDLTAFRLRLVSGIELWTHDESGKQYGFSDFNGKFGGHIDGVIIGLKQAPATPHIWENKCCGQKKFDVFQNVKNKYSEKQTLEKWDYTYFVQAQIYMHYFKLKRHYTTVALAGGRDYDSCRTEYQKEVALKYIDRAKKIIEATDPPPKINEKEDFYLCRMCEFRKICHENTKELSGSSTKEPV